MTEECICGYRPITMEKYIINLFKSEIDYKSGNCHSQIGRISFTKGYDTNNSKTTSPNVILKDIKEDVKQMLIELR